MLSIEEKNCFVEREGEICPPSDLSKFLDVRTYCFNFEPLVPGVFYRDDGVFPGPGDCQAAAQGPDDGGDSGHPLVHHQGLDT